MSSALSNWSDVPSFKKGVGVGLMPASYNEISGLARSNFASAGYLWGIDDNGELITVREADAGLVSEIDYGFNPTDPEDISTACGNVYVADTGNNSEGARAYRVIYFQEPSISAVTAGGVSLTASILNFVFSDGSTPDVEGFFVVPSGAEAGDMYFFTKRNVLCQIYRIPSAFTKSDATVVAQYVGVAENIPNNAVAGGDPVNASGADISPDGSYILIRTLTGVFIKAVGSETVQCAVRGPYVASSFVGWGPHPTSEPKGESIAWSRDGKSYYTTSEDSGPGGPPPLFRYAMNSQLNQFNNSMSCGCSCASSCTCKKETSCCPTNTTCCDPATLSRINTLSNEIALIKQQISVLDQRDQALCKMITEIGDCSCYYSAYDISGQGAGTVILGSIPTNATVESIAMITCDADPCKMEATFSLGGEDIVSGLTVPGFWENTVGSAERTCHSRGECMSIQLTESAPSGYTVCTAVPANTQIWVKFCKC